MPTVDSKGRSVLPQDVRNSSELSRALTIIDRMENLIAETSPASTKTLPFEHNPRASDSRPT